MRGNTGVLFQPCFDPRQLDPSLAMHRQNVVSETECGPGVDNGRLKTMETRHDQRAALETFATTYQWYEKSTICISYQLL
jgi:hypothetical protein